MEEAELDCKSLTVNFSISNLWNSVLDYRACLTQHTDSSRSFKQDSKDFRIFLY